VTLDAAGTFVARPLVAPPPGAAFPARVEGRFAIGGGRVLTALAVPA
jgi:hypothetical protein